MKAAIIRMSYIIYGSSMATIELLIDLELLLEMKKEI